MKKFVFFAALSFLWTNIFAQFPLAVKYQAVVRDASGGIITNKAVSFKISIISGNPAGAVVFKENHTNRTTNDFGLVNLEIGKGISELGTFSAINWSSGTFFMKVEILPSEASVWQEMGTMQLLSVPYALYAKDVQNNDDADASPTNEIQSLTVTGTNLSLSKGGGTIAVPGDNWGTQVAKTNVTLTGQGTEANPLGVVQSQLKPAWSEITGKPTSWSGYGITDVVTISADQTITGAKTFSTDILVNSLTIGMGKGAVSGNTVVGNKALFSYTPGQGGNTAIGNYTLYSSNGGNGGNTASGDHALYANTTGSNNTAHGNKAGYTNKEGNNNVFIGSSAGYYETGSNKLFIDNQPRANESDAREKALIYGVFDTIPANQMLTINAKINVNNSKITNVGNPVDNKDAVNKAYVDSIREEIEQEIKLEIYAEQGVNDVDGNHYKAVRIGKQVWMAENLNTAKFKDGTVIPLVADTVSWAGLTTPGYCFYINNEAAYKNIYGALYNWYAVNTGKLCPLGWHVPSDEEWATLVTFLGGENVAGGKMKETGTTHWVNPNTGATNESGFSGLPGGMRGNTGGFGYIGSRAAWWSSTGYSPSYARSRGLSNINGIVGRGGDYKKDGFSIRCLRD